MKTTIIIFFSLTIVWQQLCPMVAYGKEPKILVYNRSIDATIKVNSAEVRSNAENSSSVVGYVPGATRIRIDPYSTKEQWVLAEIDWAYKGTTWIKRSDVAVGNEYRIFQRKWPLDFILLSDGETNESVWIFPKNNRCGTNEADFLKKKVSKQIARIENRISCRELWEVPGTNLLLANQDNVGIDIWYNEKQGGIYLNSLYGIEIGSIVFGFRNGEMKYVFTKCKQGNSIACYLSTASTPSLNSNMEEPIHTFAPFKP